MASGSRPFYLLITLFAFIQVVAHLWPHPSAHSSQRGLVTYLYKRAEPGDSGDPQCDNVWDHSDQCAFVKEFCADYPAGLINYLYLYFCDLSSLHSLALVIMGTWMVFLFALIGIAASDYFCPNLNTIAKKLHLSESMTGVTFLAFGNASPDIFSTFSAISAGSATLAIGEVVGAASFISTVVVGSMAIGDPFRVTRVPFLRDAGFFIGCLLFTLYMVIMQKITLIDSVLLIVAYVSYVFIIVFSSWRHKRRIRIVSHQQQEWEETVRVDAALEVDPRSLIQEALDDSRRESSNQDDLNEEELGTPSCVQGHEIGTMAASIPAAATEIIVAGGHDYPDTPAFDTGSRLMSLPVRPALFLQTTDFDQSHSPDKTRRCPAIVIDTTTYSSTTPQRLGREQRRNSSGYTMIKNSQSADERRHLFLDPLLGNHNDPYDDSDDEDGDNPNFGSSYTKFQQALIHHSLILPDRHDPSTHPRSPSFQGSASSFHDAVSNSSESGRGSMGQYFQDMIPDMSYKGRLRGYFQDCIKPLFFPTLLGWHEKSWILKTLAVASIPTVLLLTLTLPVVDLADSDNEKIDVTIAVGHGEVESGYLAPRIIVSGVDDDEQEAEQCPYDGWSKVTTMIQMVGAPVFITAVFSAAVGLNYNAIPVALGVGIAMSVAVYFCSSEERPPQFYDGLAFLGFLVSMAWIFVIANEVVGILQAFGMILGVSDAILGLTVFAMGNSLGDLVSNITIAKMGFPRMAFSACFGGPLLNMLLGVGISGAYVTLSSGANIPVTMSPTILVSLGSTLVAVVGTVLVVTQGGYALRRRWWGGMLLALYAGSMVANVVLEVRMTAV